MTVHAGGGREERKKKKKRRRRWNVNTHHFLVKLLTSRWSKAGLHDELNKSNCDCDMIHGFLEGSLLLHILIFTEEKKKKVLENDAVTFVGIRAQKKKHVFLHLENQISQPGHLCNTAALCYISP